MKEGGNITVSRATEEMPAEVPSAAPSSAHQSAAGCGLRSAPPLPLPPGASQPDAPPPPGETTVDASQWCKKSVAAQHLFRFPAVPAEIGEILLRRRLGHVCSGGDRGFWGLSGLWQVFLFLSPNSGGPIPGTLFVLFPQFRDAGTFSQLPLFILNSGGHIVFWRAKRARLFRGSRGLGWILVATFPVQSRDRDCTGMSPLGSGPTFYSVAGPAREMSPVGSGPALYSVAGTAREMSPLGSGRALYSIAGTAQEMPPLGSSRALYSIAGTAR
eukprot:gene7541-biopygen3058